MLNKFLKKIIFMLFVFLTINVFAAEGFEFSGEVKNSVTNKPVAFATVIVLEARVKGYTDGNGFFSLNIEEAGEYNLIIRSSGLKMIKTKISISKNMKRNFRLRPLSIKGGEITITGKRDIQKVSRRTMTAEELKETPASFGDSINAMTSLPGVERTEGFFGPLVIRGAKPDTNRYYIDGIPINNPMHFGGLHSVVNNNMMSEVDLFASSAPSEYGGVLGAVININTVDSVKEFGGYTDMGLLSASSLVKTPLKRNSTGDLFIGGPYNSKAEGENVGYMMVSGRVGYMSLLIPLAVQLITGDKPTEFPEYWDYQFKGKYYLNNKNSITLLLMGSSDWWKIKVDEDMNNDEGADPLITNLKFRYDQSFHNQGLTYKYETKKFRNTLSVYSALSKHYTYVDIPNADAASWAKDYNIDVRPNIFGIREAFSFEWLEKISTLNGNIEYTLYDFKAKGVEWMNNGTNEGAIDLTDENGVIRREVDSKFKNHTVGAYLENNIKYGGLIFVPGIRVDYLKLTKDTTKDFRGLVSYEFPTDTTLSVASGQYSSFFQTNANYFSSNPSLGEESKDVKPERAIHSVVGLEQIFGLYVVSLEYFHNKFYDLGVAYPHFENGEYSQGQFTGEMKTDGVELMIRKDSKPSQNGLFGWLSYTYTKSKYKSGILGNKFNADGSDSGDLYDPNGSKWLNSDFEQEHSFKVVAGYRINSHTFSGRFQYYTSTPYTPIVNSEEQTLADGSKRYKPIYSTNLNSKRFDSSYRLDLRYSYRTNYKWGHISWYIEVINVTNYKPANSEEWKYDRAYSSENPEITSSGGLALIPNFGIEVKF